MAKRPRRRKPTKRDTPTGGGPTLVPPGPPPGPHRPTKAQLKADAAARMQRERDAFELRKRQAIAKASIELDNVDASILQLLLLHPYLTQEQIGELVGFGRQTVNERINAPKFQRAIALANRPALEIFSGNQAAAARVLGELLHSKDERVQIRAAIAHMWEFIHRDDADKGSRQDFVAFLQEAFEAAEANKPEGAAGAKPA